VKTVLTLQLSNGREPFDEWLSELPLRDRVVVMRQIHRLRDGGGRKNLRSLGDGVFEIKIYLGPAYRVYFAEDGDHIVLLLLGGDKGSQKRDIEKAKRYWRQYAKK
jgi:putative addiction module killer protein